jgi:signal transduction histidine kinase
MSTRTPTDTADLLSLAVHEFRTPVTVVAGYLRMLAREQLGPLTERQKTVVREAEKSCARLSALVAEMSELAQFEAGLGSPAGDDVSFDELVDEILGGLEEGRDRGVTVSRASDHDQIVITVDRGRLREALKALIAAVLREQGTPQSVVVHTGTHVSGGVEMALLAVGPGDSARNVLDVPSSARHLNESRGGLGLALPIARRVVEEFGGRVWSSATDRTLGAVAVLLPLKETRS